MGIDKSLTDEFPSVTINGTKYHYGRELAYGQYLVENAEYAKDYGCFDRKEDLLAFLVNLPKSADNDWVMRRHPDWHEVTHEERGKMLDEHRAFLRQLMEEKHKNGTAKYFNVLCFDQTDWFGAFASPLEWGFCDDVEVEVNEHEVKEGRKELLIELKSRLKFGENEKGPFTIWRGQALKLASALIEAARYVEEREPE